MSFRLTKFIAVTLVSLTGAGSASAGEIVISGTGMALAAVDTLGQNFRTERPGDSVVVLPSMGSGGGIKALLDNVLDLSISARRLKPKEAAAGLIEAFCLRTPLVFATQEKHVSNINTADLPELFFGSTPTWADGTPLTAILRAESGSEHPYLASKVPGLEQAVDDARKRHGAVIGLTDQENLDIAEHLDGALAITTTLQIAGEKRRLSPVPINGVVATDATVKSGTYPFSMKVCIIAQKDNIAPDSAAFVDFLKSPEATQYLSKLGAIVVD